MIIREKRFLDEFLSYDFERAIDECYSKLSEGRKALLSPLPGTVQYKLNIWKNEKYEINTAYPESLTHETERGEMVRSKSEEMIANFLYSLRDQLDYKYERPLELKIKGKKQIIYPDFTIFNYKTGEIFIIEHVSRLDWPNYHDSFVWKYKAYVENGMIQNGTVIYSFESENEPFTLKQIKKLVEDIILQ